MPRWLCFVGVGFLGAIVVANIITAFVWERQSAVTEGQLCLENLRRTATALSVYAATHNWRYPEKLSDAVDPETHNALDGKCPVSGAQLRYLGQYLGRMSWNAPSGVPLVWCAKPHKYLHSADEEIMVVTTGGTGVRWDVESFKTFLQALRRLAEKRWEQFEVCRVALGGGFASLRNLGWLLLEESVRRDGLSDEVRRLVEPLAKKGHFEASLVLALGGDNGGAKTLVQALKGLGFRRRMRAFLALKRLAGTDFGYRPELPPAVQKEALQRWKRWLKGH